MYVSDRILPPIPPHFSFTPEFRLVVACSWIAPPALEQDQADKIEALCRGNIDWDTFLALVRRHGVAALAYKLLCRHASGQFPEKYRATLKRFALQCSANALKQAAELTRIIAVFSCHEVDPIPLKGVFLAHQLYGELGLRQSGDIDLLVRPDDLEKACTILESEGYTAETKNFTWTAKQKQSIREDLHHFVFENAEKKLSIELHWKFKFWYPEQVAEIFHQTMRIDFNGISVLTLNNDAQLLTLSDHGAKHLWFELKWLGDVVRLMSQYGTQDCKTLLATSERLRLNRTLAHAALFVHWLYDIPIAEEIQSLTRAEARSAVKMSIPALKYMKDYIENPGSKRIPLDNFWAAYHVKRSRPQTPLHFFVRPLLTSPADYHRFPLPDCLFWLYKPLRPAFWFIRNFLRGRHG